MYLKDLKLYNFRNLKNNNLEFSSGINLITGENGQGKTNLIESIDLLSSAKSFRTSKSNELIQWKEKESSIFSNIKNELSEFELGLTINNKKEVFFNNNKINKLSDFIGKLITVGFNPSDISIVKSSPSFRRAFIDKHLVDLKPNALDILINYKKALNSKNSLLKSNPDREQIFTWNRIISELSEKIIKFRKDFIKDLEVQANLYHEKYSESDGKINLKLQSSFGEQDLSKEDIYEILCNQVDREIIYKSSLVGVHRDDLLILLDNKDSRSFASQGQSRSIVLSLKMAVISLIEKDKESPVILLDDVDAELDTRRSELFFDMIFSENRQVFITATDQKKDYFRKNNSNFFSVKDGEIKAI